MLACKSISVWQGLEASTIIDFIIPEPATGIVATFDIRRFQGVTALALITLWKPLVFAINI
jgi:hypothetical protein